MKLFGNKKNKQDSGINSSNIHVKILRLMSDRTPVEILTFDAVQQRDENFNIQIVNEDFNFKEELQSQRNKIIEYLRYRLNLANVTKEVQKTTVEKKITELEDKISELEKSKDEEDEDNNKNLKDYKAEIMHYKVLKYSIENSNEGSYERINIDGQREIHFCYQDGVLVPYFMVSTKQNDETLTMYPDVASKRKFYRESDNRIVEEFMASQTNFFTGFKGMVVTVAIVLLVLGLVIGNLNVLRRSAEQEDIIRTNIQKYALITESVGLNCAYYYSNLMEKQALNNSLTLPSIQNNKPEEKRPSLVDISDKLIN